MRGSVGIGGGAGLLSRKGQLFAGGPAEAWLQRQNPAGRLVGAFALIGIAAFVSNPLVLAGLSMAVLLLAVVSFLDIPSILRMAVLPVLLLAAPTWLVAVVFFDLPWPVAGLGVLRVWCSVTIALVMLHSIGLINISRAMRSLGLPQELCTTWGLMIAQAASFSEVSADMEFARRARQIKPSSGRVLRRLVGGQVGILFARMIQRGNDVAMAMNARELVPGGGVAEGGATFGERTPDAGQFVKSDGGTLFLIEDVTHEFEGGNVALEGINVGISAGGCTAIIGANGSGKSTLLHLLSGLLTPAKGRVLWNGSDNISAENLQRNPALRQRLRRAVGIVFQDPDCQWLCDTVQEEVEFGPRQIWEAEEARTRANQAMVMMGINHLAGRVPYTLSGGQKRRVALASVIATDPQVLLLDEPTLSLDAATTDFLLDWLREFLADADKTLILTSHDLGLVNELAGNALVLTPCNRLARQGSVEEILMDTEFLQQMNLASRRRRPLLS